MRLFLASMLFVVTVTGCRADDPIRQGDEGEFCNGRDEDCRRGLVCELGVCVLSGPRPVYDCGDVCTRLAECDAEVGGCQSDCRLTTTDWSLRARNEFGVCMVEELSCDEARETFTPQVCYSRIEVPDARRTRCDAFVDFARDCGADNDVLERLLEGCVAIARVSKASRWDTTATCEEAMETGICDEVATCFNAELELNPPIALN
jgi:hypothetical protein